MGRQIQDERFTVLRANSGHGSRISIERVYVEAMGDDLLGGLFISQIVFWSGRSKREDGFFYRTYEDWEKYDYLSAYQVRKYAKICEAMGWLETKVVKAYGAPTVHYRIKQKEFMDWYDSLHFEDENSENEKFNNPCGDNENFNNGKSKISFSNVENFINHKQTQKTDTEKQTERAAPPAPSDAPPQTTLPGVNYPRPRKEKLMLDGIAEEASKMGLNMAQIKELSDTLLSICGLTALADAEDEWVLLDAKRTALKLARIGYGTSDMLLELGDEWREKYEWRKEPPSLRNLEKYASQKASGAIPGDNSEPEIVSITIAEGDEY